MDNMLKIEQGVTPGVLPEGGRPAEMGAERLPVLGSGEEGFHQPTWAEENPQAAAIALIRASAAGRVELSPTVGVPDPVEDHFRNVSIDKIQAFIAEQQGKNLSDTAPIKLPDGTSILFGEYKKIAAAIQAARAKSDRRPIEEIVREARRPAPQATAARAPEPQPAPRPGDWRESLPSEQRQRLQAFEAKIANLDVSQLQVALGRLKQLQAVAPIEGWQSQEIQEADADSCLKIIAEKLQSTFPNQVNQLSPERLDQTKNLSENARTHVQYLIDKFRKDKNLEKLDFLDLVAYVQAEYKKAGLIGKNAPSWLLPPHLKGELLPVFGLSLEIPLPLEPKEKNART